MMKKRHLPLLGLALSLPLFWLAITNYPGGNDWNTAADGFSFTENYVSALFQPKAINGAPNSARAFAVPAMLIFCTCISFLFWAISKRPQHRVTSKVIQIFGIGSMVYTFLGACTVMHDLLVVIAAAFFVVAVIGMLFMSHTLRRPGSMFGGLLCLALLLALSAMRHGNVRLDLAPITEWLLFALSAAWLTFVYYAATTSNNSFKPNPLRPIFRHVGFWDMVQLPTHALWVGLIPVLGMDAIRFPWKSGAAFVLVVACTLASWHLSSAYCAFGFGGFQCNGWVSGLGGALFVWTVAACALLPLSFAFLAWHVIKWARQA